MPEKKYIETPPGNGEEWREAWSENRRYPPGGGVLRRIARSIYLLLSGASGEARRQLDFNLAVLDLLRDLRSDLEGIRDDLVRDLGGMNTDLMRDIQEVDSRIHHGVARGDALIAAVDRKIEALASRLRDLSNPVAGTPRAPISSRSDFHYRRMEDALRGSEKEVREASARYLDYAKRKGPVIDVGCGRGEFLELCRSEGIEAAGFDANERAVADLVSRGLDARLGFIPGCFEGVADQSVGTIIAMHVIEHLPFGELYSLFTESKRVLKPDGYLVLETPNAESIVSSAREFWKDPTHLGPRHQAALVMLGRELGFDVAELGTTAPYLEDQRLQIPDGAGADVSRLVNDLNALLYGDQNLRLVLKASGE